MQSEEKKFGLADKVNAIDERKSILNEYERSGWLDRKEAIQKIRELRISDETVRKAASIAQISNRIVPFEQATMSELAEELKIQISILLAEVYNTEEGNK